MQKYYADKYEIARKIFWYLVAFTVIGFLVGMALVGIGSGNNLETLAIVGWYMALACIAFLIVVGITLSFDTYSTLGMVFAAIAGILFCFGLFCLFNILHMIPGMPHGDGWDTFYVIGCITLLIGGAVAEGGSVIIIIIVR